RLGGRTTSGRARYPRGPATARAVRSAHARGSAPGMATNVSEQEARQVAEAAREAEWRLPSFGRELFLGNLRLDLIHPQPRIDPAKAGKGERSLAELRECLEAEVDPLVIEHEERIPDDVVDGLKRLGALGMKVPEEYGGLGLSQVHYNQALALAGSAHASL